MTQWRDSILTGMQIVNCCYLTIFKKKNNQWDFVAEKQKTLNDLGNYIHVCMFTHASTTESGLGEKPYSIHSGTF